MTEELNLGSLNIMEQAVTHDHLNIVVTGHVNAGSIYTMHKLPSSLCLCTVKSCAMLNMYMSDVSTGYEVNLQMYG